MTDIGKVARDISNATQRTQSTEPLKLSDDVKSDVVKKKATCPFIGTAVMTGNLPVRTNAQNPTASIDDVVKLGNLGGGDLGNVLKIFAEGNHAFGRSPSGKLDQPLPEGQFSLEFPGSQGSHPGHSGILQGNPLMLGSGRFSDEDFARLTSRAKNGYVKRSDIGKFIAENLRKDPNSKVFGTHVAGLLAKDLGKFVGSTGPALLDKLEKKDTGANRKVYEALTKTLGEDNLIGSAGEFGLLMAFFANKPGAQKVDGEPAISVADLTSMFKDKQFPPGWETWKKTSTDWVKNTTALLIDAGKEYLKDKPGGTSGASGWSA
jgi:hypothetical protein